MTYRKREKDKIIVITHGPIFCYNNSSLNATGVASPLWE